MIPFVDLKEQYTRHRAAINSRIHAVLEHGQYIMGPEVSELENQMKDFADCGDVVTVSSGSDALLIALMAVQVGPSDAVFLPSFTFPATAEVVVILGATPVFVDVDEATCNISPRDFEDRVDYIRQAGKLRPRAVIPVDLYGRPADYDQINLIAEKNDMMVLSDGAQSFGGTYKKRSVGNLAPMTATSFFPAKPLGCYGDGGAILTRDKEAGECLRSIRAHGKGASKYSIDRIGVNGRLDTIQAAILLAKLSVFQTELVSRERVANHYSRRLADYVATPPPDDNYRSAWAQYTIKLQNRDHIAVELRNHGIPTGIYYPRGMHQQPPYAIYEQDAEPFPICERLCNTVLSLPMHPYLREPEIDKICDVILGAL